MRLEQMSNEDLLTYLLSLKTRILNMETFSDTLNDEYLAAYNNVLSRMNYKDDLQSKIDEVVVAPSVYFSKSSVEGSSDD